MSKKRPTKKKMYWTTTLIKTLSIQNKEMHMWLYFLCRHYKLTCVIEDKHDNKSTRVCSLLLSADVLRGSYRWRKVLWSLVRAGLRLGLRPERNGERLRRGSQQAAVVTLLSNCPRPAVQRARSAQKPSVEDWTITEEPTPIRISFSKLLPSRLCSP